MTDPAADAVMALWNRIVDMAEQTQPDEWTRLTPCPEMDVRRLIAHIASTSDTIAGHPRAPEQLLQDLQVARDRQGSWMASLPAPAPGAKPPGPGTSADYARRLLGACCLDMYVHTYDLATALGRPLGLGDDASAVAEASRYLRRLTPGLLTRRMSLEDGTKLRIDLRGEPDDQNVLIVHGGHGRWTSDSDGTIDTITADPAALILLLSGRIDPPGRRDGGLLTWSGTAAEAFIHHARLS